MRPRDRALPTLAQCGSAWLACLLIAPGAALAYSDESLARPVGGQRVSNEITFTIDADDGPQPLEFYRIVIATDDKFENVVATYDMQESRAGWSLGDLRSLEKVPVELRPANFAGVHFRSMRKLNDGHYFWRAYKSVNNSPYEPIDGVAEFLVDTTAPEELDSVRLRRLEDGRVQIYWQPVGTDERGLPDVVAGFRVYQYDKPLKRYPVMTRHLAVETQDTQAVLPAAETSPRIVFYLVNPVDQVGNEPGRKRPAPLGSYAIAFNPPDFERLSDPKYLKQLAAEEAP